MRLNEIRDTRASVSKRIPDLSAGDISAFVTGSFQIHRSESLRRTAMRRVSSIALRVQQGRIARKLQCTLSAPFDLLSMDERFGSDASMRFLLKCLRNEPIDRVLVPGCYLGGEDVQFWLRRGAARVDGVDVNSLAKCWKDIVPALRNGFDAEVEFAQGAIERLAFPDDTFDLVTSVAVLEHVNNLSAMASETARVLRPGGWARHEFGPLYYTFGGDHCISSAGEEHGYDHLSMDEDDYQSYIWSQRNFEDQDDPNLPFWARRQQLSYATVREYLEAFRAQFDIRHVLLKMSEAGLNFRTGHPEKWARLLSSGVPEEDLLIKSVCVVLQKPVVRGTANDPRDG